MSTPVDSVDWLKWMRLKDGSGWDIFSGNNLSDDWVLDKCETACEECFELVPEAQQRWDTGRLSERMLAEVVCQMVLRVARWTQFKSESDGSYTYTNQDESGTPPAFDASPNLKPTKHEMALLRGYGDDAPTGTVRMGLDRVYGL